MSHFTPDGNPHWPEMFRQWSHLPKESRLAKQSKSLSEHYSERFWRPSSIAKALNVTSKTIYNWETGLTELKDLNSCMMTKIIRQYDNLIRFHNCELDTSNVDPIELREFNTVFSLLFNNSNKECEEKANWILNEKHRFSIDANSDLFLRTMYHKACAMIARGADLMEIQDLLMRIISLNPKSTMLKLSVLNDLMAIEFMMIKALIKPTNSALVATNGTIERLKNMLPKLEWMMRVHPEVVSSFWNVARVYDLLGDKQGCSDIWDVIVAHPHSQIVDCQGKPIKVDFKLKQRRVRESTMNVLAKTVGIC